MDDTAKAVQPRDLRLSLARRQIPEILAWAGALTLAFGVVNYVSDPGEPPWHWATNLVFGPLFLALAWVIRRGMVRDRLVPWLWASCGLVLVVTLALGFRDDPVPTNLAYLVAVMTAFGPLTHLWPPFWCAAATMLAVSAWAFATTPGVDVVGSTLVCLAALLISAVLLRLRTKALAQLADTQAKLDRQATYDPLTDVLNRNGLQRVIPLIASAAQRSRTQILVWFVDMRGLKEANDQKGHGFGDELIRATADALRACVRGNDVVARWGGDEFIVIGEGAAGSAEELDVRVNDELTRGAGRTAGWAGGVTVGFACGPGDADVCDLIAQADTEMYRRRSAGSD